MEVQKPTDEIRQIFERYKAITGHTRAILDDKRRKAIRARLMDGFTAEDLELAFYGCTFSSFHQGENDRQQRYDSITLILRDADQVEKFRAMAEHVIQRMQAKAQREKERVTSPEYNRETQQGNYLQFLEQARQLGVKVKK